MTRTPAFLASAALFASALAFAGDALALGPVDLEVGLKGGYATNPSSGPVNPLGAGLGGRAGVAFLGGVYVGGNVMYYFGGSSTGDNITTVQTTNPNQPATTSSSYSITTSTLMYGGELGYGVKLLDLLTLRPQIGVGDATFTTSGGGSSASTSNWYLEPGLMGLVGLGLLFVGADINALFFPGATYASQAAFSLHAQVGIKF